MLDCVAIILKDYNFELIHPIDTKDLISNVQFHDLINKIIKKKFTCSIDMMLELSNKLIM